MSISTFFKLRDEAACEIMCKKMGVFYVVEFAAFAGKRRGIRRGYFAAVVGGNLRLIY